MSTFVLIVRCQYQAVPPAPGIRTKVLMDDLQHDWGPRGADVTRAHVQS